MQGNLDYPPLVIAGSRAKTGGLFAFCAVGLLLEVTMQGAWWWLFAILFGLGVFGWGVELIRGLRLTISPSGIVAKTGFSTKEYSWDKVANFRPYQSSVFYKKVEFDLRKEPGGPVTKDDIGGNWEIPVTQVAAILNQARLRWIDPNQVHAAPYPQAPQYQQPPQYAQPYPQYPQQPPYPQQYPAPYPPQQPPQYYPQPAQYPQQYPQPSQPQPYPQSYPAQQPQQQQPPQYPPPPYPPR